MCDYSLMAVPNRLAQEGEELVAHRFPTGSIGLASQADVRRCARPRRAEPNNLWTALRDFFNPPRNPAVCAVCIPPGAKLELRDIPVRLQQELSLGPVEQVTFTQLTSAVNTYRDAVRFGNGREIRLQELREGQRVLVLDLSLAGEVDFEALRAEREEFALRFR